MKNSIRLTAAGIALAIALGSIASAQTPPAPAPEGGAPGAPRPGGGMMDRPIVRQDLGGDLYFLRGGSNSTLAVAQDGAILVDTQFGSPEKLVMAVQQVTDKPVKIVINTQDHADHTGANAAFGKMGATAIYSTPNAAKRMAVDSVNMRGAINPAVPPEGRPNKMVTGPMTVTLGKQTAKLYPVGAAHTDGDLFVYFPGPDVLATGDIHHSNEYPVYDAGQGCKCGSYNGMLKAYEAILKVAKPTTKIVPGHGGLTNGAEVKTYYQMLVMVRDKVKAMIAEGKTEDEVVAAKILWEDHSVQAGGPDNRDGFIRTVYKAFKTGQGA